MLHVIQQFTGINIIQFYGPAIMKDAGFGGDSPSELLYSMMFLSTVNTVGNFIGVSLSSKHGRRELMLKCTVPMGISLLIMAGAMIINAMGKGGQMTGWICIGCLSGYLMFFCIGFASQPWTVCGEIFPAHLRGTANSITTTTNWLFNYLLSAVFLLITSTDTGKIIAYIILALSCFIAYWFTYIYVPETKDRSLEDCIRMVS